MDTSYEDGLGFVATGGGNSPVASSGSSDAGSVVAGGSDNSVMTNGADGTSSTTSGDNGVNASMNVGGSEGGAASSVVSNPTVVNSGDLSVTNSVDSIKSPDNHIDMAQNQTDSNVNVASNSNVGRVTNSSLGGLVNTNAQADFSASGMVSQNMDGTITQNLDGTGFSSFSNTGGEKNSGFDPGKSNDGNIGGVVGESTSGNVGGFVDRNIRKPFSGNIGRSFGGVTRGTTSGLISEATGGDVNTVVNGGGGGEPAAFSNQAIAMGVDVSGVVSNQQGKKKTGLIIGIVVAAVCVIVGVILFLTVGLSALDPKTGDNIKAKNYQEAFNIYANYFLFGERSKKEVDWGAVGEEGSEFVSYFSKVVDSPLEVEDVASGLETVGDVLSRMVEYYKTFQEMYSKLDQRTDSAMKVINEYGNELKFMDKFSNVGLPQMITLLEIYTEKGYDYVGGHIREIIEKYKDIGVLFNKDVSEVVGGYGSNQLAMLEIYDRVGCLKGGSIDYECIIGVDEIGDVEYLQEASRQLNTILVVEYNAKLGLNNSLRDISDGIRIKGESE